VARHQRKVAYQFIEEVAFQWPWRAVHGEPGMIATAAGITLQMGGHDSVREPAVFEDAIFNGLAQPQDQAQRLV
jgi:hypothetical protein